MNDRVDYGITDLLVSAAMGGPDVSGTSRPTDWFVEWANGGQTNDTGVIVNGDTVLTSGPVWQATTIIAGDVAKLPLNLYRRIDERNKERDRKSRAHWLLNIEPNALMLPFVFRQTLQAWALLWGNGCAYIPRGGRGEVDEMIPLRPDSVTVIEDEEGGGFYYYYTQNGKVFQLHPTEVFHIRGLGDPLWGYSVIDKAANSIGYNLALQKYGSLHFKQGGKPSGVIQLAQRMSRDDREEMRREWDSIHRGIDNAHRVAILQQGATFNPYAISNEAAEFLDSRKFSREEIAAWYNLPPYKLGAMENSSVRANLEQQNQDYLNTTLEVWLTVWRQECAKKLLTVKQRFSESHFFQFNTDALLRSDTVARYEAYAVARQWGWVSVNDIRDREDLNSIGPQGDIYMHPLNMVDSATGRAVGEEEPEDDDDVPDPMVPPEQEDDDDDETPPSANNRQARAAVAIVVREAADRMCRLESERIRRLARKPDSNFVDEITGFYRGWNASLCGALRASADAAVVLNCGTVDMNAAVQSYCDTACTKLLDIAGTVTTTSDLATAVDSYAESWTGNSHQLIQLFLGDSIDASILNSSW